MLGSWLTAGHLDQQMVRGREWGHVQLRDEFDAEPLTGGLEGILLVNANGHPQSWKLVARECPILEVDPPADHQWRSRCCSLPVNRMRVAWDPCTDWLLLLLAPPALAKPSSDGNCGVRRIHNPRVSTIELSGRLSAYALGVDSANANQY